MFLIYVFLYFGITASISSGEELWIINGEKEGGATESAIHDNIFLGRE